MNRDSRRWHTPAVVAMTLVAIGFKEQGLVIVPLAIVCWWTGAPSATSRLTASLTVIGAAYVLLRLSWRGDWPVFEQSVGLGFRELEVPEATARFGSSPYLIYAYNAASTIANALLAEPARGVFRIVRAWSDGQVQAWHLVHMGSSIALTCLVGWWGIRRLRTSRASGWSIEARVFVAWTVVLLACGALSFNYSRERLWGMAVPFYGIVAFFALREAILRAASLPRSTAVVSGVALMALAVAWQTRAIATIEYVRATAWRNHLEWLVLLPDRRIEFSERPGYLDIMDSMIPQGVNPASPRPTRYPQWVALSIGQP
jgi:hypothetical protein